MLLREGFLKIIIFSLNRNAPILKKREKINYPAFCFEFYFQTQEFLLVSKLGAKEFFCSKFKNTEHDLSVIFTFLKFKI